MAIKQLGGKTASSPLATVWGLGDLDATGTGIGTFEPQSGSFGKEADSKSLMDANGDTFIKVFKNQKKTLSLTVIPTGATLALAKSANILPSPGTIVTVTSTDDAEIDSDHGGRYILESASKSLSNNNEVTLTFELEQPTTNDVAQDPPAS